MTQTSSSSSFRVPKWMWLLAIISVIAIAAGVWRAVDGRSAKKEALEASTASAARTFSIPSQEWFTVQPRQMPLGIPITVYGHSTSDRVDLYSYAEFEARSSKPAFPGNCAICSCVKATVSHAAR